MVYVCSDLHGLAPKQMKALLSKAGFGSEDFLFVLGDVIDRGEYGIELLEWFMVQPNVKLIMGNHEAMMAVCNFIFEEVTDEFLWSLSYDKLKLLSGWLNNGGMPTLQKLRGISKERIEAITEYIKEAPLYDTVSAGGRDFLLVHSGLENFSLAKKPSDYSADELLWVRPCLEQKYYEDIITVFGHTPTELYGDEFKGKILRTDTWINIDTGDTPSLLRLDDLLEFYL